jgi:hypothetical protein
MKMHPLPWSGVVNILSQNKLALLGGVLLWLTPLAAQGQSVTLGDAQRTLSFSGLPGPVGVAVDSRGDVFVAENGNNSVGTAQNTDGRSSSRVGLLPTVNQRLCTTRDISSANNTS